MGDAGEYWRDAKAHFKRLDKRNHYVDPFYKKELPKIKEHVQSLGYRFIEFTKYHYRVINLQGVKYDFYSTTSYTEVIENINLLKDKI